MKITKYSPNVEDGSAPLVPILQVASVSFCNVSELLVTELIQGLHSNC